MARAIPTIEDEMAALNAIEVYPGITRGNLEKAFNKVCDPRDWRAPIKAVVADKDLALTIKAIDFFTACVPVVTFTGGEFVIECEGYRNGPAGP
jgi:hypothetical protein